MIDLALETTEYLFLKKEVTVAKPIVDAFRKAVNDAGINGKNWRKNEAFDDFTQFFNVTYTEDQRQSMKYDEVLKVSKTWWEEHHSKYS